MKTTIAKHCGRFLGVAAAALLAVGAQDAQAIIVPISPVGQWDCAINGSGQKGILFLNFTTDIDTNSGFPTFEGFFIQAGRLGNGSGSTSVRGGSTGRSNSGGTSTTNLFGGGFIEGAAGPVADNGGASDWLPDSRGHRGNWYFNSQGQVVGSFFVTLNATARITNYFETCVSTNIPINLTNGTVFPFPYNICFTNAVLTTNLAWFGAPDGETGTTNVSFTNENFTLGFAGVTNNISFVGKVAANGSRITMTGSSTFGKLTITGVPLQQIPTVSGLPLDGPYFWTGMKTQDGTKLAEVFNLTFSGIPNLYGMTGQGPSYSYGPTNSFCMISASKQIGFVVVEQQYVNGTPKLATSRASVGKFINTKKAIGGNTIGDSIENLNLIGFDAFVTPFIP
jgi:hypothetical protein